jgi:ubiquinone/menaquinone biosynthesis C-methylase UbiE
MSVNNEQFLKRQSDFWDNISQSWSLSHRDPVVGWYNEHQAFPYEQFLFRNLPINGGEIVLEYGCGPARNLVRWSKKFARIDGVDIAPGCIEKAKIHLASEGITTSNLWVNDGRSLEMISDVQYDIVFMTISHQHITSRSVRLNLYREFLRVLKPNGILTFQTGFGPSHPRSVDYFADTFTNESDFVDKDVRVENVQHIKTDLEECGFVWVDSIFTQTVKDEHDCWIFIQCQKPNT